MLSLGSVVNHDSLPMHTQIYLIIPIIVYPNWTPCLIRSLLYEKHFRKLKFPKLSGGILHPLGDPAMKIFGVVSTQPEGPCRSTLETPQESVKLKKLLPFIKMDGIVCSYPSSCPVKKGQKHKRNIWRFNPSF